MLSLAQIPILRAWKMLGGPEPRRCGRSLRAPAFWRDGHGLNVSIDAEKNVWHDFRDGSGGGILALIERANNCSHRDAVAWLVREFDLPTNTETPQERAERLQRQRENEQLEAEFQAGYRQLERELCARLDAIIGELRDHDDDDLELELQITYQRLDHTRALIRKDDSDFDDATIRLARAILDRMTEGE